MGGRGENDVATARTYGIPQFKLKALFSPLIAGFSSVVQCATLVIPYSSAFIGSRLFLTIWSDVRVRMRMLALFPPQTSTERAPARYMA